MESQIVQEEPSSPHQGEDGVEDTPSWDSKEEFVEEDPLQLYYKRIGYLPPLDDATIEFLEVLSMSNPTVDPEAGRIAPKSIFKFRLGLRWRMVDTDPDDDENFHFEEKQNVPCPLVPEIIKDYDEKLWGRDLDKCQKQIQEAIFQRTMMLSMIDRYRLFYGYQDTKEQSLLEFAVETAWTCVPMPTHAERRKEKYLTAPKPDLAVGFRREKLFQDCDWESFPKATQRIICYEGEEPPNFDRTFYFLTIEAKHNFKNVDDPVALNQCLNNASQALHNMYEFFKEADREIGEDVDVKGDKYTKIFFDRVRFFSVVAVAGAMKIRIHRACRMDNTDRKGPRSEYPLKYVFSEYKEVSKTNFTHQNVVKELTEILHNYGVNELAGHLKGAIEKTNKKFVDYSNDKGEVLTRGELFYCYNQAIPPLRGKSTPRATRTPMGGTETPKPPNRRGGYHRAPSSALSQSHSISDDLDQLNVGSGNSSEAGHVVGAQEENFQEVDATQQEEASDVGTSGPPKKRTRRSRRQLGRSG